MVHPAAVLPHIAQSATATPSPSESDISEMRASSSFFDPSNGYSPSDPGSVSVMENGFLSSDSAYKSVLDSC